MLALGEQSSVSELIRCLYATYRSHLILSQTVQTVPSYLALASHVGTALDEV